MTDNEPAVDTGRAQFAAAADVFAARKEIDAAIADLAASPLDEAAADQMRKVLAGPRLRRARKALTTNLAPKQPLRLVTDEGDPTS